jgi:hypothetical protein
MGEISTPTPAPFKRGEGLSIAPKTDDTPITAKSTRAPGSRSITQGEPTSRVVNDGGLELTIDEPAKTFAPETIKDSSASKTSASKPRGQQLDFSKINTEEDDLHDMARRDNESGPREVATADKKADRAKKRKGVFADKAMKKSGKRKPTKKG